MITPIIMLGLLVFPHFFAKAVLRTKNRKPTSTLAAIAGISALFLFTGIGHFVKADQMTLMLPAWVPQKELLVFLTGALEVLLAICILPNKTRRIAARIILTILVLFLPANIYAAINSVEMGGHSWGASYLFLRIPLQLAIFIWVYWFTLKNGPDAST